MDGENNSHAPGLSIGDPSLHASYYFSNPKLERKIYRSCRPERAQKYIKGKDYADIVSLDKTGDFHKDSHVRPVAYFTTDLWYAAELARDNKGVIVQQKLPANFDVAYQSYVFTTLYSNRWEQVVRANRQGIDAPKELTYLQNTDLLEGPTSNVCTKDFKDGGPSVLKIRGWQLGFAKAALVAVAALDKHIMTAAEVEAALVVEGKQPRTKPTSWN